MKYEAYVRISNMLIYELKRQEDLQQDADNQVGMRKAALVEWYLEQIEAEIDTEQELERRRAEVKAVIDRLVKTDCVLIELKAMATSSMGDQDPVLVVHPNYQG